MAGEFRVGITRDAFNADGSTVFDPAAFRVLDAAGLGWEALPERDEITAGDAARYDALLVLRPRVGAAALGGPDRRLRIVARLGVGYDNCDVPALGRAGVLLTITPDGVRRPVATAILTLILALSGRLLVKDRLTREGRWAERTRHMGVGLTGKTVGSIGLGNIGREAFRLLAPLEMVHIAHDPVATPEDAAPLGVRLVDRDTVFRESDFVMINCPLTEATRGLVGAREIGLMKPGAFLVNTARGPIVDEKALTEALVANRIAGAGLDVFETEPTPAENPLLRLENVVVTPHSLCWTDECFRRMAEDPFASIAAVARGERPRHVVIAG